MVRFLQFVFVRDFWLKLMALVCATVIWFYVEDKLSVEETLTVPLLVQSFQPPKGYMILALNQDKVHVTLRGPKGLIQRAVSQGLVLGPVHILQEQVDTHGEDVPIGLRSRDFDIPHGLSITSISPRAFAITLARSQLRELRVRPNVIGTDKLAAGYSFQGATVAPDVVEVRGPPEILDKRLQFIETEPIDISGMSKSIGSRLVAVKKSVTLGGVEIPVSHPDTFKVSVGVRIGPELTEVDIRDVPIRWYTDAKRIGGVKLEPERVTVRVRGPRRELSKLSPESIKIRIDIPDLGVASYEGLIPEVVLPRGFKLAEPEALLRVKATLLPPAADKAASAAKANELE